MLIALDYDETFTRDPIAWGSAMTAMRARGHQIIGVTMRYEQEKEGMDERYANLCHEIYFTGRRAKRQYLSNISIFPDVWIDDTPECICRSATPIIGMSGES